METKLIECKLIDIPKVSGTVRTFNKEFAYTLADSIKMDGQLCPITVRLNPASPGRYILVIGKHRLFAIKNVLKEQFIAAVVCDQMDAAEAAFALDAENLWRNPLNKAQHSAAFKRWHAHWLSVMPQLEVKAIAPVAEGEADDDCQTGNTEEAAKEAAPAPVAETEADFDAKVAATTGQSLRSVRRTKSIANAFTAEQLEVFIQMEVSQTDMLQISRIKDESLRAEVVNLIASGMVPEEAIKEVCKDIEPVRETGKSKAANEAKKTAAAEVVAEQTDEEWFVESCGEKAAMLGDTTKYKSDALLYRSITELRHYFRSKGKKAIAESKKAGNTGGFWNLVNRFASISHPKDWLLCINCAGKGRDETHNAAGDPVKCPKCYGAGYLLKTEEYL